jgi:hypothetical protein
VLPEALAYDRRDLCVHRAAGRAQITPFECGPDELISTQPGHKNGDDALLAGAWRRSRSASWNVNIAALSAVGLRCCGE